MEIKGVRIMQELRLMDVTSRFASNGISAISCEGSISPETLRNYIISVFKCLDEKNLQDELKPIKDAFGILILAEQFLKNPPTHTDWIVEPSNLDEYWTWNKCVQEAVFQYYKKDNTGESITCNQEDKGVGIK
jgi:hypothetical protein